jgi:hypothetical protein
MKKVLPSLLIIGLFVVLAFALNPAPEKHDDRLKQVFAERNPLAGSLGIGALSALLTSYHSLGVASYTQIDGKTVTVGAFGLIHVF